MRSKGAQALMVGKTATKDKPKETDYEKVVRLLKLAIGPRQALLIVMNTVLLFLRSYLNIEISDIYSE